MPLKQLKPVQSVVAGKALASAKSVVSRSPEERMAFVDKQIYAITARMRKLRLLALVLGFGGIAVAVGLGVLFWYQAGEVFNWSQVAALPELAASVYCANVSSDLGNELRALAQERRSLAKEFPDSPYFHAPIVAP